MLLVRVIYGIELFNMLQIGREMKPNLHTGIMRMTLKNQINPRENVNWKCTSADDWMHHFFPFFSSGCVWTFTVNVTT